MYDHRLFLKFLILLSLGVYLSVSENRDIDHYQQKRRQNEIASDGIIAKLNKSDSVALADVIEKEPKFFDEFECKYIQITDESSRFNGKLESEKTLLAR